MSVIVSGVGVVVVVVVLRGAIVGGRVEDAADVRVFRKVGEELEREEDVLVAVL